MKSSSCDSNNSSFECVESRKESSLSRLFNRILGGFFVLQVVIGVVVIVFFIGDELSKMQLAGVENTLSSRKHTLETYLGDRLTLLEGYAKMPTIIAGTMNPTGNKANTVDFIAALSMLKDEAFYSLQDFRGRPIYVAPEVAIFLPKGADFQRLMEGKDQWRVDAVTITWTGEGCCYWRLSVPVVYNGLSEGVLTAYIPISLDPVSTVSDTEAVRVAIIFAGETIMSMGHAVEPVLSLEAETNFDGVSLVQEVSTQDVNKRVKYLVTVMIVALILGTLTLLGVLRLLGKKYLVVPHARLQALSDELEVEVEKRTADLKMKTVQLSIEMREKKEAANEARETGQLVTALLEGIGAAFFIINPKTGLILRSNSLVQTLFGIASDELTGQSCMVAFANSTNLVSDLLCPDCTEENPYTEGIAHHVDGLSFPVARYLVSVDVAGEQCIGVILLDITERKALERRLNVARKLESVGELASGIAHEINTPIQYVGDSVRFIEEVFEDVSEITKIEDELIAKCRAEKLHVELIEKIDELSEEADMEFVMDEIPKACARALDGTERVAVIVRAMKNFAHPGHGEKTPVDINQALENTITVAKNEWKYVADVVTDFDPVPVVPCYAGDINQVFLNMLVNAAHSIEEVVAESGGKGTITISTRMESGSLVVRISDTGTGISKDDREKIFDPFFTTKEVGKGTGQGLAIAHDVVVERHGGTIDVESELGEGTTFVISLPGDI